MDKRVELLVVALAFLSESQLFLVIDYFPLTFNKRSSNPPLVEFLGTLQRDVYLDLKGDFELSAGTVLKLPRPLYGLCDSRIATRIWTP